MTKIAIRNLSKAFGRNAERALAFMRSGGSKDEAQERYHSAVGVFDVSLDIEKGELFVLMGLSGSGKSTLLRLLNRLHEPTSGEILIDGTDITKLGKQELLQFRRQKFSGMVFQNFAILPHRTVLGNVAFGLELHGTPTAKREERAREMISAVGLAGWEDNYPAQLSGGMQQRVGLARALAVDADILLMDEAFSALDPLIRREMQDELIELQERLHKTIVFVTHDLDEALKLGNRIAIMKDAQVVQVGTPEEIIAEPANDYVEAFVEGVNRSEVLTAGTIMQRPREIAHMRDGPRTALTKMRRHGLSGLFVVDSERRLQGYVEAERLAEHLAGKSGAKDERPIDRALLLQPTTVRTDTPVREVMDLATAAVGPLAVLDDKERLSGVIVKGAILAALVGRPSESRPATAGREI